MLHPLRTILPESSHALLSVHVLAWAKITCRLWQFATFGESASCTLLSSVASLVHQMIDDDQTILLLCGIAQLKDSALVLVFPGGNCTDAGRVEALF